MSKRAYIGFVFFFLLIALFQLLNLSMQKPLDHDEHQFVASGVLLAREGVLMYRDYPYFHMPYLVYLYAFLFSNGDHLLLTARLFSSLCAFLTVALIFFQADRLFRDRKLSERFALSGGCLVLLMGSPLFVYTAGLAWNHDFPLLLAIAAFLLHSRNVKQDRGDKKSLLSGLLLGTATGVRLTYAPLFAPFFLLPLLYRRSLSRVRALRLSAAFGGGFCLALLPAGYWLWQTPQAFLFGNLQYPWLNTLYRESIGYTRAMDLVEKLRYSLEICLQPGNLLLILGALWLAFRPFFRQKRFTERDFLEIPFILLLLPFLLLGTFAPTPSFKQYYYPPLLFISLAMIYGLGYYYPQTPAARQRLKILGLGTALYALFAFSQYPDAYSFFLYKRWETVRIHKIGQAVAKAVEQEGKILTFSPTIPLEGGLPVYKEFTTGPFAWRTARFLSAEEREQYHMLSEAELPERLSSDPPAGILLGFDWRNDPLLARLARNNGYTRKDILNRAILFIPPETPAEGEQK